MNAIISVNDVPAGTKVFVNSVEITEVFEVSPLQGIVRAYLKDRNGRFVCSGEDAAIIEHKGQITLQFPAPKVTR
jgi:hypothetical protein